MARNAINFQIFQKIDLVGRTEADLARAVKRQENIRALNTADYLVTRLARVPNNSSDHDRHLVMKGPHLKDH